MNRGQRRFYVQKLERAHTELGRAYEHVIQLNVAGHAGTERMQGALHRLHKAESKIQTIRAEMTELQGEETQKAS